MFTKPDDKIYSPAATIAAFEAATGIAQERQTLYFAGIFRKAGNINYNGHYYNRLDDGCFENKSVTLLTPCEIHEMLADGTGIEFTGHVGHKIDACGIMKVIVTITMLKHQKLTRFSEDEQQQFELLRKKSLQGFNDMSGLIRSKIIKNEQVVIKIVTPRSGIAEADIKAAMGPAFDQYTIKFKKVSFDSKTAIIHALKQQEYADIVCVARGGGDGVEIFNDIDICKQLLLVDVPVASAIGHAQDVTLFQKLADTQLEAPTSLGFYLKDIYMRTKMEMESNASAWSKQLRQIQDFSDQKELLARQHRIEQLQAEHIKKDNLLLTAGILLIILVSAIVLRL